MTSLRKSLRKKTTVGLLGLLLVGIFFETNVCAQRHTLEHTGTPASCGSHASGPHEGCESHDSNPEKCECDAHEHGPIRVSGNSPDLLPQTELMDWFPAPELLAPPSHDRPFLGSRALPPTGPHFRATTVLLI